MQWLFAEHFLLENFVFLKRIVVTVISEKAYQNEKANKRPVLDQGSVS